MPRKPRIHIRGGFYHVILRGNNKQDIFRNDKDRIDLGDRFAEGMGRYGGRIHAWCWMTNHIHVLLQTGDRPVGQLIRWVAGGYARAFNKRNNRTGHLFERRHLALPVQADRYLLPLVRYIHLNPVKAAVVKIPEQYRWSSYQTYLGLRDNPWLTTSFVLQQFSKSTNMARKEFRNFTSESFDSEPDFDYGSIRNDKLPIDEHYPELIHSQSANELPWHNLCQLIADVCGQNGVSVNEVIGPSRRRYLSPIRAAITEQALRSGIASLAEVARALNRTDSVVLRTMKHWQANRKGK